MSMYSIQVASKLSGVGIYTLRAWERRYQAVVPQRNESGRRLYSDADIEKLKLLSELCYLGNPISTIANLELTELKEALKKQGKKFEDIIEIPKDAQAPDLNEALNNLLLALEFYKLDVISHEVKKLTITLSPRDLAIGIITPLLQAVGVKVSNGSLTIAQEHALSSIIKFHIGGILYRGYERKSKKINSFIFATPNNDHHEFGILLSALICCHHGINFTYLSTNLPVEALEKAYKSVEATNVVIGTTYSSDENHQEILDNYIETMLKKMDKNHTLWVGGSGFYGLDKYMKNKKFKYMPTLSHFDEIVKNIT